MTTIEFVAIRNHAVMLIDPALSVAKVDSMVSKAANDGNEDPKSKTFAFHTRFAAALSLLKAES